MLVAIGELPHRIADLHALRGPAAELRTHVCKRPQIGLRPIDLVALRVEFAAVFGNKTDADEIDGVGRGNEFGVEPISHVLTLLARMQKRE